MYTGIPYIMQITDTKGSHRCVFPQHSLVRSKIYTQISENMVIKKKVDNSWKFVDMTRLLIISGRFNKKQEQIIKKV